MVDRAAGSARSVPSSAVCRCRCRRAVINSSARACFLCVAGMKRDDPVKKKYGKYDFRILISRGRAPGAAGGARSPTTHRTFLRDAPKLGLWN